MQQETTKQENGTEKNGLFTTPVITLGIEQCADGTWRVSMDVSGLPDQRAADLAARHIQRTLCGEEIVMQ